MQHRLASNLKVSCFILINAGILHHFPVYYEKCSHECSCSGFCGAYFFTSVLSPPPSLPSPFPPSIPSFFPSFPPPLLLFLNWTCFLTLLLFYFDLAFLSFFFNVILCVWVFGQYVYLYIIAWLVPRRPEWRHQIPWNCSYWQQRVAPCARS